MVAATESKAVETIDLSDPRNLDWIRDQWSLLVETNEWLRQRELDLIQQNSELKQENTQLRIRLEQQRP